MKRVPRRFVAAPAALLVLTAACGGGGKATKSTSTTAPPAAPLTTAAAAPADVAPLTGLPQPDAARRGRVALVVKIDNAPKARPQIGLNQADVVVEEKVEDGVTRFFAIFQTNDADPVGPVRSARTTDITLVTPLRRPLFAYSGTNATFQQAIDKAPLVDVGIDKAPGDYRRQAGRPAPYNLFSSTSALFRHAPADAQAPPALFPYRPAGTPLVAAGARPVTQLHLEYRGIHVTTVVDYAWDAAGGVWRRAEDGNAHNDAGGAQVAPRNVVVAFTEYKDTGQRDRSNTVVPEAQLIGSGPAWILTDGKVVEGTWTKPSADAVPAYTDGTGRPVPLTPGQTWVELPPPGAGRLS